jgi:glycosyltransferase involved in cell wall biosynthesis
LNILIITYFFPPENGIAPQRPYSWAKYWSRAGHDVTVLTVPKHSITLNNHQSCDDFHVIEVPIPGVAILRKLFSRNDNSNPSSLDCVAKDDYVASIRKLFRQILAIMTQRYGVFWACRMPDFIDFWGGVAFNSVKNQHWDLVVSTAWPYGVHRPAYRLRKTGMAAYWIADWRDLWTDNHMFPGLPGFRMIERKLERLWSQAADAITTVSEPLAETLRKKYGKKVHVVYNGFDPEDYEKLPIERIFPEDGLLRIVYTGTIYDGQRDPSPLFEAIHMLHVQGTISPDRLRIIFCGRNSNVSDLAQKYLVREYVEYAGYVQRLQALQMQRDASILLFLEFESKEVKGILTGKLFEYMFAGPPIWGVGVDADSSAGLLLLKTGRGKCFGKDVKKIIKEIEAAISSNYNVNISEELKPDYQKIYAYSREEQSKIMLSLLS